MPTGLSALLGYTPDQEAWHATANIIFEEIVKQQAVDDTLSPLQKFYHAPNPETLHDTTCLLVEAEALGLDFFLGFFAIRYVGIQNQRLAFYEKYASYSKQQLFEQMQKETANEEEKLIILLGEFMTLYQKYIQQYLQYAHAAGLWDDMQFEKIFLMFTYAYSFRASAAVDTVPLHCERYLSIHAATAKGDAPDYTSEELSYWHNAKPPCLRHFTIGLDWAILVAIHTTKVSTPTCALLDSVTVLYKKTKNTVEKEINVCKGIVNYLVQHATTEDAPKLHELFLHVPMEDWGKTLKDEYHCELTYLVFQLVLRTKLYDFVLNHYDPADSSDPYFIVESLQRILTPMKDFIKRIHELIALGLTTNDLKIFGSFENLFHQFALQYADARHVENPSELSDFAQSYLRILAPLSALPPRSFHDNTCRGSSP